MIGLIFLGAPGSGKGTQAKRLAQKFTLEHISTGDMLRNAIKDETELGLKAKTFMDAGQLVPDNIILEMIKEELTGLKKGFIFDGFPRTVAQAEGLDKILGELDRKVDAAINLTVDDSVLIDRLSARRICKSCGTEYNLKTKPPRKENICDLCGGELYRRSDDAADVINKRLQVYYEKTKPMEDYYRSKDLMVEIDGNRNFDEVFGSITDAIGEGK